MRSEVAGQRAGWGLKLAAGLGLAFLLIPLLIIFVYAFTTEEKSFVWPPPGLTFKWFGVALGRADIWPALTLSLQVAAISTLVALILGTLCVQPPCPARNFSVARCR